MNSDCAVEIFLCSTHVESHSDKLHHLVDAATVTMATNYFFFSIRLHKADHLEEGSHLLRVILGKRVEHVHEFGAIHLNMFFSIFLNCLALGQSYRSDWWVGKDDSRDIVIVHL